MSVGNACILCCRLNHCTSHYFIISTSTFPLYIIGKKSLAEMREFYFKARDDVFHDPKGGLTFNTDVLQAKLQIEFGTDMRMNYVKYPRYTFMYNTV